MRIPNLWRWDGTIDRGAYALIGLVGFAIKHNVDRFIAATIFRRRAAFFEPFNYWIPPTRAVSITALPREDAQLLVTLLAAALPFIWVGVVLTLRRLRSAGLPTWLVAVFFLPVLNLFFFLLLSVLPSRERTQPHEARGGGFKSLLDRIIPDHALGSAAMGLLVTLVFGVAAVALGTKAFAIYGWGLFVALPFCQGLVSVLIYGYHRHRTFATCLIVSTLSTAFLGAALLALAIEGIICLAMAWPIALVLSIIGGSIGYAIQRRPGTGAEVPAVLTLVVLFVPLLMAAEQANTPETPSFEVRTALVIDAPPERVWRRLISFPDLPAPTEWAFRLGIAYPIHATVQGKGPGAVRECLFSTGTFVEPVEVWDEPRLLKFAVASEPLPMRELTPYREIHPRHLHGYLQPEDAQFLLTPLPGGRTLLEGTSRYRNKMWPASYWQLWSDWIVHRIHLRVFNHIKRLAEQEGSEARFTAALDRRGRR